MTPAACFTAIVEQRRSCAGDRTGARRNDRSQGLSFPEAALPVRAGRTIGRSIPDQVSDAPPDASSATALPVLTPARLGHPTLGRAKLATAPEKLQPASADGKSDPHVGSVA